jgi:hypothetical protein
MGDPGESRGRWVIRLLVLLCAVLGVAISLYTFSEEQKIGNKHHEVALYRELIKEFHNESKMYREIRMAIERCKPLYTTSSNGPFDNDQINSYLGFFEDIGFYWKRGVLNLEIIDHGFGAYIVEAYEYGELKRYIQDMHEVAKQPKAFENFEKLAQAIEREMEKDPSLKHEISIAQRGCLKTSHPKPQGLQTTEGIK